MFLMEGPGGIDSFRTREWVDLGPSAFCSAWHGTGGVALLHHRAGRTVGSHLWDELERAAHAEREEDLYLGVAGIAPVLAATAATNVERARAIGVTVLDRCRRFLERDGTVTLGFAHGLAGVLVSLEQCAALLGVGDEVKAVRHATLSRLESKALDVDGFALWAMTTDDRAPGEVHGICHGAPGICLAAILGWRYSGDDRYASLVDLSLPSVPIVTSANSFCCGTLGRIEVLIEAYRLTKDETLLSLARQLFSQVDPSAFRSERWSDGRGGHRFTRDRLESPMTLDLPGYPLEVPRLGRRLTD